MCSMKLRRKVAMLLPSLFLCVVTVLGNPSLSVSEQIEKHREWVRTHVSKPDTLNVENLLVETAKAITTSCLEEAYVAIIRYAGVKLELSPLIEYADLRQVNGIDKDERLARKCLKLLSDKSAELNIPYATAYIKCCIMNTAPSYQEQQEAINMFHSVAQVLYETKPSPKNKELWLYAQFSKILAGSQRTFENPLVFEKFRLLAAEIICFYHETHIISDIRAALYRDMDIYGLTLQLYPNYQAYINSNLAAKEDSILQGNYLSSYLTDDSSDEVYSGRVSGIWAAIRILEKHLHPYHPDVLGLKLDYCLYEEEMQNGVQEQVKSINDYSQVYYGKDSYYAAYVNSMVRYYNAGHQLGGETDYLSDFEAMKAYVSESSEGYLKMLGLELQSQLALGNKDNAIRLSREIKEKAKEIYDDDKIKELSCCVMDWFFQKNGITGYETAFDDLVSEFLDYCSSNISFETIGLGKNLIKIAGDYFNDAATALRLQRQILLVMQQLVDKHHPLFAFEYLLYGGMAASAYPVPALTLDGREDAESLSSDIIDVVSSVDGAFAYSTAGRYMLYCGHPNKAKQYLIKALDILEVKSHEKGLSHEEQESNRYYLASMYSQMLQLCNTQPELRDSINYYGEKLIQAFGDGFDFHPSFHSGIYSALSGYYMYNNRVAESEVILNKCLAYYDKYPNATIDGFYVQLVKNLIMIYGNHYNNMDKCLQLAERVEKDIQKIQDWGSYENQVVLLEMIYDLLEYKNPYDVRLFNYMNNLKSTIDRYLAASRNSDNVWFNHSLYLYTKMLRFARDEQMYRQWFSNYSEGEIYETQFWNPLKQGIINYVIPDLLKMEDRLKEISPQNYMMSPFYSQILLNLAIANQKCTNDKLFAERLYKELAECNKQYGLALLGNFYLEEDNVEKAIEIFEEYEKTFLNGSQSNGFGLLREEYLYSRLFIAYYRAGEYEKSLKPALACYNSIQSQIEKNIDLFTESEREAFMVKNGGGGGVMLQALLPHLPEKLSSTVYNVALREKGMLLRASERIRQSILASNDSELKSSVDSLRFLRQQIMMQTDNSPQVQNETLQLREKYEKLERYVLRASEPYRQKEDVIPTWEEVRNALKKDEACVEFVLTDSATYALVITSNSKTPQVVSLVRHEDIAGMVEKSNQVKPDELAKYLYEEDAEHLYEKFWKPLEQHIGKCTTVYYSPTGFLNFLAFAAFPLPEGGYLIDMYDLHQLTSTGMLVSRKQKKQNSRNKTAKIYGAIYYNDNQQTNYSDLVAQMRTQPDKFRNMLAQNREATENFPFLPCTIFECDEINKVLSANSYDVKELIEKDPTEHELRQLNGKSPDILHISTHGFFVNLQKTMTIPYFQRINEKNSMTCTGLVFANGEYAWQGEPYPLDNDNLLSASEVSSLNLDNTELVVLSACETGLGAVNSDGVYGLLRGFKQAGAKSICASLWSVNDLSTSQLMQSFYSIWISKNKGKNKQKAMRDAMLEQRDRTPSPYHWAPFVLYDADL